MEFESKIKQKFNKLVKNYKSQDILILAIETSCDETSVAVVKNGNEVLSNIVSSQIDIHARFGGVVPEVASRNHILAISTVYKQALEKANIKAQDLHAIAVTYGAGLMGALLVGVSFAKALGYALQIPLIGVNHIYGHISANYISSPTLQPPFMSLIVSGGHTALIKTTKTKKIVIATTHDDAIGEAYDKVAKVLGLGYPGGPIIDKLAKLGSDHIVFVKKSISDRISFSYSGLKTAVINYIHKQKQAGQPIIVEDVCASFQKQAVLEVVEKTIKATQKHKLKTIVLAGGVAANSYLRQVMKESALQVGIEVVIPPMNLCTDNAAMIGAEAYDMLKRGEGLAGFDLTARPNIHLKFINK